MKKDLLDPINNQLKIKPLVQQKKKELTPVEEVEEYLRMEATKEKDLKSKKQTIPFLPSLLPFCTKFQIHDKLNKIENSLQA